jgi:Xaa-Pro dipeptidase
MNIKEIQIRISRKEKYPAKQHLQRVASELGVSHGLIYLLGQYGSNGEDSDQPEAWKQRRYFY